jgi:hypothetical protein
VVVLVAEGSHVAHDERMVHRHQDLLIGGPSMPIVSQKESMTNQIDDQWDDSSMRWIIIEMNHQWDE